MGIIISSIMIAILLVIIIYCALILFNVIKGD